MRKAILARLRAVERTHNVSIVYAVEAGSRAYGLHTPKSDYDVRFIFVHRPSVYLSVRDATKHETITVSGNASLDMSGWDIRKALRLLRASNPSLLEWLGSPVVYVGLPGDSGDGGVCADGMRKLAGNHMSARACMHHYYSRLRSQRAKAAEDISLKKFLHVLRPLLAVRFLEQHGTVAPTEFRELVHAALDADVEEEAFLITACERLARDRYEGRCVEGEQHWEALQTFVDNEIARLKGTNFREDVREKASFDDLDALFTTVMHKVWLKGPT